MFMNGKERMQTNQGPEEIASNVLDSTSHKNDQLDMFQFGSNGNQLQKQMSKLEQQDMNNRYMDALSRILRFQKDIKGGSQALRNRFLIKKYDSENSSSDNTGGNGIDSKIFQQPERQLSLVGGQSEKKSPIDKISAYLYQRQVKAQPKNQVFNVKRDNEAVFFEHNAKRLQSQDMCVGQLQLVGNQFLSKANPESIIKSIEQKRAASDGNEVRDLMMFLKRRYQDQPGNENSRLQEMTWKYDDSLYDDKSQHRSLIHDEQKKQSAEKQNTSIYTVDKSINGMILEEHKDQSRQPTNIYQKQSQVYFSQNQGGRHRKLISQTLIKQNGDESIRETDVSVTIPSLREQLMSGNITRPKIKRTGNPDRKGDPQNSLLEGSQQEQRKQTANVRSSRIVKRISGGVNIMNQNPNYLETDEERIERMLRFQKQVKAKYNDISLSKNTQGKQEPYRYVVIRGNNSELIKRCLDNRNGDWKEIQCSNTLFNFKWVPFSKGIRFDYLSGHGQRKMVNHFEFQEQISEKDNLYYNMERYYESQKRNVFNVLPVTFVIDFSSHQSQSEIERFQQYFNILDKHQSSSSSERLSTINRELQSSYLFPSSKAKHNSKYCLNRNMFDGQNFWLIKPTDYNRGRGVQVFNSLDQFKKLINEYQQGVEVKFSQERSICKSPEPFLKKQSNPNHTNSSGAIPLIPLEQQLSNFTNLEKVQNIVKTDAFVVQKYLERPLLINKRKFDIRLWVLVAQDGKAFLFKEGYIRTSSYEFDMSPESIDKPFIHLTNNAVQKCDENYGTYEEGNQLSFKRASGLLKEDGIIYIVIDSMRSVEQKINKLNRKFCMEIFGYDFIIDEELHPWLIEINTNPCLEETSELLRQYVPRMLDDALKLTIDVVFPPKRARIPKSYIENVMSPNIQEVEDLQNLKIIIGSEPGFGQRGTSSRVQSHNIASFNNGNALTATINGLTYDQDIDCQKIQFEPSQSTEISTTAAHQEKQEVKGKYPVPGYSDSVNMWGLIYQLRI